MTFQKSIYFLKKNTTIDINWFLSSCRRTKCREEYGFTEKYNLKKNCTKAIAKKKLYFDENYSQKKVYSDAKLFFL